MSLEASQQNFESLSRGELEAVAERARHGESRVLAFVLMATPVIAVGGLALWIESGSQPVVTVSLALAAAGSFWLALAFRHRRRLDAAAEAARAELERRGQGRTLEMLDPAAAEIAALSTAVLRAELAARGKGARSGRLSLVRRELARRSARALLEQGGRA